MKSQPKPANHIASQLASQPGWPAGYRHGGQGKGRWDRKYHGLCWLVGWLAVGGGKGLGGWLAGWLSQPSTEDHFSGVLFI
jgi:hypothetical protein